MASTQAAFDIIAFVRRVTRYAPLVFTGATVCALFAAFWLVFVVEEVYESSATLVVLPPPYQTASEVFPPALSVQSLRTLARSPHVLRETRRVAGELRRLTDALRKAEGKDALNKPDAKQKLVELATSNSVPVSTLTKNMLPSFAPSDFEGAAELDVRELVLEDLIRAARVVVEIEKETNLIQDYKPLITLFASANTAKAAAALVNIWSEVFSRHVESIVESRDADIISELEESYRAAGDNQREAGRLLVEHLRAHPVALWQQRLAGEMTALFSGDATSVVGLWAHAAAERARHHAAVEQLQALRDALTTDDGLWIAAQPAGRSGEDVQAALAEQSAEIKARLEQTTRQMAALQGLAPRSDESLLLSQLHVAWQTRLGLITALRDALEAERAHAPALRAALEREADADLAAVHAAARHAAVDAATQTRSTSANAALQEVVASAAERYREAAQAAIAAASLAELKRGDLTLARQAHQDAAGDYLLVSQRLRQRQRELAVAQHEEDQLRQLLDSALQTAASEQVRIQEAEVEQRILDEELNTIALARELLAQKLKEARARLLESRADIRAAARAVPPERRVSPQRTFGVVTAFLVGLVLTTLVTLAWEAVRLESPADG